MKYDPYAYQQHLREYGIKIGENCMISPMVSFYGHENIEIGNNVRIDDFCVISAGKGKIKIGDNIHISIYTSLQGAGYIEIGDFSTISSRVSIYSSNDDYSGKTMTNPMIPSEYTGVEHKDVIIKDHVIIGSGSVILPGVTIGNSCAIGALSLVKTNLSDFGIYAGAPIKYINKRDTTHLALAEKYIKNEKT